MRHFFVLLLLCLIIGTPDLSQAQSPKTISLKCRIFYKQHIRWASLPTSYDNQMPIPATKKWVNTITNTASPQVQIHREMSVCEEYAYEVASKKLHNILIFLEKTNE